MNKNDRPGKDDGLRPNPMDAFYGYHLRRASVAMMDDLRSRLQVIGLRVIEATVLMVVAANPRITQSEVGRMLGIQRANMAPLAASLEARGLIEREAVDGRSQGLCLTAQGRKLTDAAASTIAQHEAHFFGRDPNAAELGARLRALWT